MTENQTLESSADFHVQSNTPVAFQASGEKVKRK